LCPLLFSFCGVLRRVGIFLNLQEVAMRYVSLVLASLLTIGCGNGVKSSGDPFKAVVFSPPAITTLTPGSVPVNSVPFSMTINGSNFGTDAVVFWNGTPLNTRFITSSQLMAALTDTNLSFWGMIPVYVRSGGMNSNTMDFNLSPQ
jgi:hypothetical protein